MEGRDQENRVFEGLRSSSIDDCKILVRFPWASSLSFGARGHVMEKLEEVLKGSRYSVDEKWTQPQVDLLTGSLLPFMSACLCFI